MQNQHPASFLTLSPQTLILNSEVSHVLHVQSISNAWKLFLYIQKLLTANSGFSSPCILTTAISFLINYFSLWWAPVMIIQNMDRGLIMFACPFNQMESSPRYLHPKFISLLKKKINLRGFFDTFLTCNLYCLSTSKLWYSTLQLATCPYHWAISFSNKNLCSHPSFSSLRTAPDLPFPLLFWSFSFSGLEETRIKVY